MRRLTIGLFVGSLCVVDARARDVVQASRPAVAANTTITAVPGIKVGHHTLTERPTGCTVVLTEAGATAGIDVRGAAPGTRETDLLNPVNSVQQVHAIVLAGGSAEHSGISGNPRPQDQEMTPAPAAHAY